MKPSQIIQIFNFLEFKKLKHDIISEQKFELCRSVPYEKLYNEEEYVNQIFLSGQPFQNLPKMEIFY